MKKEEVIPKTQIVIDTNELERIQKKYPSVDYHKIEKQIIDKCKYYSTISQDSLESNFGFENGKKKEFIEVIKDFITLIQHDYKKPKKQTKKEKKESPTLAEGELIEEYGKLEYYDDEDLINKKFPKPQWLIENQIPLGEVGVLAGKRGERKTFYSLYQSICIAAGKECVGDKVGNSKAVLFISEEDSIINLVERIKLIKKGLGIEKIKLPIKYFTMNNFKLDESSYKKDELLKIIEEFKPSLIVVDSFQRVVSLDVDKDNKEISEFFMDDIIPLSKKYECSWLFIHHLRKGISGSNPPEDLLDEIRGGSELVNISRFVLICSVPKNSKEFMVLNVAKFSYSEKPEPKVISFNNSEEEGLKVEYVGKPEDVLNSAANCARTIKKWLFDNNKNEFRTKELKEASEALGFKKSWIDMGIKFLKESQWVKMEKRGYYVINQEENQKQLC